MTAAAGERAEGKLAKEAPVAEQRIDKWLWFARLAKSRTQAAALVTDGRIRINRQRIDKPSAVVKTGDVVTATVDRTVRILRVAAFVERRGPAAAAGSLYEELTPRAEGPKRVGNSSPESAGGPTDAGHAGREPGAGRPTKRDRRAIDRLKSSPR